MAQVVAFQTFAPRIGRRPRAAGSNGDGVSGKVIIFTGVWHERLGNERAGQGAQAVKKPGRRGPL